jgi:hypothetical protein
MRRLAAALSAALVLTAGCGMKSNQQLYLESVDQVIGDDRAALLIGEGACELYEDGADDEEVLDALAKLGFPVERGRMIRTGLEEHLCPEEAN